MTSWNDDFHDYICMLWRHSDSKHNSDVIARHALHDFLLPRRDTLRHVMTRHKWRHNQQRLKKTFCWKFDQNNKNLQKPILENHQNANSVLWGMPVNKHGGFGHTRGVPFSRSLIHTLYLRLAKTYWQFRTACIWSLIKQRRIRLKSPFSCIYRKIIYVYAIYHRQNVDLFHSMWPGRWGEKCQIPAQPY